jgi:4-amino-4-deoxy-L-arabinose transferase-like glycosyltransferase
MSLLNWNLRDIFKSWKFPALIAVLECGTHFGTLQGDSMAYIDIVRFLRGTGNNEILQWHGILRPVVPVLAYPFSFFVSYGNAIALVNSGFILLGTVMMYFLGSKLFDREVGCISAISFACAIPVLAYGVAVLTDGAGYAMLVTLIYVTLFKLPEKKDLRIAFLLGLLFGAAVLTKETNFIGLVFLWVNYLVDRKKFAIVNILVVSIVCFLISFGWSHIVGHSYLGFYGEGLQYGTPGYKGPLINVRGFSLSAEYAYALLLPFVFLGFFIVERDAFRKLMEILFCTGALVLLWPTPPEGRFTFLTFPALIPLAAYAVVQASVILGERPVFGKLDKRYWLILILLAVVVFNNFYTRRLYFRLV